MKYFLLLFSLTSCSNKLHEISKDQQETLRLLDKSNRTLSCLIKLQHTPTEKLRQMIGKPCVYDLNCVRKYIDKMQADCENGKEE